MATHDRVNAYLRHLVARLQMQLGSELIGVYATGSFALGDFDARRSDLDLIAVTSGRIVRARKERVVGALRHPSLPCPVRGLEFIVYRQAVTQTPTAEAAFELNLNTGPLTRFRVDYRPDTVERHWFPIDRAIAAASGVALWGPPAAELFAPMPRSLLIPVVRESLRWHLRRGASRDDDAVLNACRALRFVREGVWSSKGEAGRWALEYVPDPELVAQVLRSRDRKPAMDHHAAIGRERVERLVGFVSTAAIRLSADHTA